MKFVPVPGTKVMFCTIATRKKDYRAYANAHNGVDDSWKEYGGENDPVGMVSWKNAKGFCAWLSAKEGRNYRLPTDHEWSCAVGIGDKEDATATPASKSGKIADVFPQGRQPASKGAANSRPNKLGLHDMPGDETNWCEDWLDSSRKDRVLRGGSWNGPLCSSRSGADPESRDPSFGFRVVAQ